jgi:hypothetical protein
MHRVLKYSNIENELPDLVDVLKNALQTDFLHIRLLDKECDKYAKECTICSDLKNATYVIYSPHVKKEDHHNELFVFLDATGNIVCHVGGQNMELYGLLKPNCNLSFSEEKYAKTCHCTLAKRYNPSTC